MKQCKALLQIHSSVLNRSEKPNNHSFISNGAYTWGALAHQRDTQYRFKMLLGPHGTTLVTLRKVSGKQGRSSPNMELLVWTLLDVDVRRKEWCSLNRKTTANWATELTLETPSTNIKHLLTENGTISASFKSVYVKQLPYVPPLSP